MTKHYIGIVDNDALQQQLDAAFDPGSFEVGDDFEQGQRNSYVIFTQDPSVMVQAQPIIDQAVQASLDLIRSQMIERIGQASAKTLIRVPMDPDLEIKAAQAQVWLDDPQHRPPAAVISGSIQWDLDSVAAAQKIIADRDQYLEFLDQVREIKSQTIAEIKSTNDYVDVKRVTQSGILRLQELEQ